MKLEGCRIVVTGAAGMIGSNILDQLIKENPKEIIAFDKDMSGFKENCSPDLDYSNVTPLEGDITRMDDVEKALKGADFVIHTAGVLTKETSKNLRVALDVNICGTYNLLEVSAAEGIKKFVYSSSMSVYGNPVGDLPMTEEHPFNTEAMYGSSKVAAELLLRVFRKSKGLDYVALRYTVVYGPRQVPSRVNIQFHMHECFDRIAHGLPPTLYGDGSQQYDYIYVGDVARANVVALKRDVTGEAFNIGTGITTSLRGVVELIREVAGSDLEPKYSPLDERVGRKNVPVDVTKAQEMLGFKSKVSLQEGLTRLYEWRAEKAQHGN